MPSCKPLNRCCQLPRAEAILRRSFLRDVLCSRAPVPWLRFTEGSIVPRSSSIKIVCTVVWLTAASFLTTGQLAAVPPFPRHLRRRVRHIPRAVSNRGCSRILHAVTRLVRPARRRNRCPSKRCPSRQRRRPLSQGLDKTRCRHHSQPRLCAPHCLPIRNCPRRFARNRDRPPPERRSCDLISRRSLPQDHQSSRRQLSAPSR